MDHSSWVLVPPEPGYWHPSNRGFTPTSAEFGCKSCSHVQAFDPRCPFCGAESRVLGRGMGLPGVFCETCREGSFTWECPACATTQRLHLSFYYDPAAHAVINESRRPMGTAWLNMPTVFGVLLSAAAAYSFSFAIDLLLGGVLREYPATAFVPVVTWSLIATVASVAALRLAPMARSLLIPPLAFGALAFLGGIVGHRYSLLVGLVTLLQAFVFWRVTAHHTHAHGSRSTHK